MRITQRWPLLGGIIAINLLAGGCGTGESEANPPIPSLLQGVTAGGGWGSACPPRDEQERKMIEVSRGLALSPELDKRLKERFPPGTQAGSLEKELSNEGFRTAGVCETDRTISRATFFRNGRGLLPYSTSATVYWKVDEKNSILWTAGMVTYSGL